MVVLMLTVFCWKWFGQSYGKLQFLCVLTVRLITVPHKMLKRACHCVMCLQADACIFFSLPVLIMKV
jgi:hypothetical protein